MHHRVPDPVAAADSSRALPTTRCARSSSTPDAVIPFRRRSPSAARRASCLRGRRRPPRRARSRSRRSFSSASIGGSAEGSYRRRNSRGPPGRESPAIFRIREPRQDDESRRDGRARGAARGVPLLHTTTAFGRRVIRGPAHRSSPKSKSEGSRAWSSWPSRRSTRRRAALWATVAKQLVPRRDLHEDREVAPGATGMRASARGPRPTRSGSRRAPAGRTHARGSQRSSCTTSSTRLTAVSTRRRTGPAR